MVDCVWMDRMPCVCNMRNAHVGISAYQTILMFAVYSHHEQYSINFCNHRDHDTKGNGSGGMQVHRA